MTKRGDQLQLFFRAAIRGFPPHRSSRSTARRNVCRRRRSAGGGASFHRFYALSGLSYRRSFRVDILFGSDLSSRQSKWRLRFRSRGICREARHDRDLFGNESFRLGALNPPASTTDATADPKAPHPTSPHSTLPPPPPPPPTLS